jgi:hypothetical protein
MQLSLKQKALLQTFSLFALAIVASAVVAFILSNVSTTVLLNAIGIGLFAWFGYMFYSLALSRLEHEEKLKETFEKFEKKD